MFPIVIQYDASLAKNAGERNALLVYWRAASSLWNRSCLQIVRACGIDDISIKLKTSCACNCDREVVVRSGEQMGSITWWVGRLDP